MDIIVNLDLFSVGIAIAAIVILGFTIFYNNRKSITNQTFLAVSVTASLWSVFNYLSYQFNAADLTIWLLRLEIFFAIWYAFLLYQLFYVFPKETYSFSRQYKYGLITWVSFISILNLTPLVFNHVGKFSSEGKVDEVVNGPGIALFGLTAVYLLFSGFIFLINKTRKAKDEEKHQYKLVTTGTIITYSLVIAFNFVFPAFLNNPKYISLGAVFTFPFILFTGYAIFKHKLLNIKILSTEVLTFLLAIAMLFEVMLSRSAITLVFRFSVFLLVLGVGILLIRSVLREVKQKEELQVLTERLKNANEQLKTLDKARAEFISIASHQLRTPPATIKWYLSSVLSGDYGQLDPQVKDVLVKTEITNNLLISLIEDMLNVSRIERGKMEFLFAPTDLLDLTNITVEQLLPMAQVKGLKLEFKKPRKKLPQIMADKEKLRQVINNIIDNAIKYTKEGFVTVRLKITDNNELRLEISDSGRGVSPENAQHLFEKYKRGQDSIKDSPGLGLGLYVAKIIIEQHKGKIWVESPGEGKGSTFIFTLPINNNLKATTLLDLTKTPEKATV